MKHELSVDFKDGDGEDGKVYRWRCSCGALGRRWEDRHIDVEDAWKTHVERAGQA